MRKSLGLLALTGLVAVAAARLVPAGLGDFTKALQDAKTLKTSYTVQTIGGASDRYMVELQKPNLLHVETPTQIVVSDGKNLTTYDKAEGVYYKQPVTDASLGAVFYADSLNLWAGFFNPNPFKSVTSKSLGTKPVGGKPMDAVEAKYDEKGQRTVTYFLDTTDKVARKAQIDLAPLAGDKSTMVVNAKDVQIGGPLGPGAFAFKAPDGSRETTLEEMSAAKWLTDLDEAKAIAKKTGKKIFVDFMATWCGPCKMLDAQVLQGDRFKQIAKEKLVLLRIDVDAQKNIASMYNIEAMPAQMVLDADGNVVKQIVGYGGPDMFFSFLLPALG